MRNSQPEAHHTEAMLWAVNEALTNFKLVGMRRRAAQLMYQLVNRAVHPGFNAMQQNVCELQFMPSGEQAMATMLARAT